MAVTAAQGTFCNVPDTCDGVALADGTCCSYELSKSGTCCEVVDKDMECCESGVLDVAGVCQGTAVSLDYNGQTCTVSTLEGHNVHDARLQSNLFSIAKNWECGGATDNIV